MIPTITDLSEKFMGLGSVIGAMVFLKTLYELYIPREWRDSIYSLLYNYTVRLFKVCRPYNHFSFDEYEENRFRRNEAYTIVKSYLSERISMKGTGLKANFAKDCKTLVLALDDDEKVTDEFQGVTVWWKFRIINSNNKEKRQYRLTYQSRYKKLITESYMSHIIEQGREIAIRRRQRKLFTNIKDSGYSGSSTLWSHIEFTHAATFDTLAMETTRKHRIIDDLLRFSKAKDYYKTIGKPWKRGYLLYGPPGTGKSTMVAVMANFLEYDIYDLELTSVQDNTQLRRLLIETSSKAIIVIEDIDCSLDLTGQRLSEDKENEDEDGDGDEGEGGKAKKKKKKKKKNKEQETKRSEVTLSGLLNFIDGIWSACGEERIIVFTTNYIEKLDPALIRRGRMDVHIEMSYCCFEAFKVLARNYLKVESHPLFDTINKLLEETKMTPADVGENLMPKSLELDVEACLGNLIRALEKAKEDDKLKAEQNEREAMEKAKLKVEEDEKKFTANGEKVEQD